MAPTNPTIDYNVSIDSNIGSQRIDYEYSSLLVHQRESSYPFTAFMVKMAMEKSITSTIFWFDTRPAPETDTVGADYAQPGTNAAQAVTVTTPKAFKPSAVIEFPNSVPVAGVSTNQGIVTAVGATTIDVRPHDPALVLTGATAGDPINILFSSYEQGSGTTVPSLTRPIRGTNNTTILRDSYQVAKTHENQRFYAAPERARARAEKEIKHLVDLNKVLMFGKDITGGGETTYQTNVRTQTKGFEPFLSTNVFHYGASLTSTQLFDYMTAIHENSYGAEGNMNRRLVFASSAFMSFVSSYTLTAIRYQTTPAKWGASVTTLEWNGWTWDLVLDPVMTKFRQGAAFIMQPRYIKYKPYRPTQFRGNIQNPEVDYVKDEFLTEPNFEFRLEEAHAAIYP